MNLHPYLIALLVILGIGVANWRTVDATRFKLTANEIDLTLWYSQDDEWLALESIAKGGHIIRYELS